MVLPMKTLIQFLFWNSNNHCMVRDSYRLYYTVLIEGKDSRLSALSFSRLVSAETRSAEGRPLSEVEHATGITKYSL